MKTMMHKHNRGFTLVELMIAVAIISILAALAVPTYRDYTIRAKISEAINMAASAKVSIAEFYISEGRLPNTLKEAGLEDISTRYIASLAYGTTDDDKGQLIMTLTKQVGTDLDGKKIVIETSPDHGGALLRWSCAPTNEDGVDGKYLPANCRGA